MINIVTGKRGNNSLLLSLSCSCGPSIVFFCNGFSVDLTVKQILFLQCALSCFPLQFGVPPSSLVKGLYIDAFLTMSLLFHYSFLVLVSFSFMSPQNESLKHKEKYSTWCFDSSDSLALYQGKVFFIGVGTYLVLQKWSLGFVFFVKSCHTSNTTNC